MNRHILLSPIGRSPGTVTGIYYALQDQKVEIDAVALLSTASETVKRSADWVEKELGKDKVTRLSLRSPNREKYTVDFDNEDAAVDFIRQVNAVLMQARKAGDKVFLGITAGRSSMGALATLSAYVYGAAGVYHLWVDREIEKNGDIDKLDPFKCNRYLNPPPDLRRLINLRFETFDALLEPEKIEDFADRHPNLARAVTDVDMAQFRDLKIDYQAGEMGIPSNLLGKIRKTISDCAPIDSDQDLRALFVEDTLRPWKDRLPEVNSRQLRVDHLVNFLWDQRDDDGERILIHFLRTLHQRAPANTQCARELATLLELLGTEIPDSVPQVAHPMSYEDFVKKLRRIFAGSELEPVLSRAIALAQLSGKESDAETIIEIAEKLKPHFKPGLWDQVKQDLRDWDTWKAGADRLLGFVEAVATPLSVAGVAAMFGLTLP